MLHLWHSLVWC